MKRAFSLFLVLAVILAVHHAGVFAAPSDGDPVYVGQTVSSGVWNATSRKYSTIEIWAGAMTPTSAVPATAVTKVFFGNSTTFDAFRFKAGSITRTAFSFVAPEDWDNGTMKARFYWTPNGTSGTAGQGVAWGWACTAIPDGGNVTTSTSGNYTNDLILIGENATLHVTNATPIKIRRTRTLTSLISCFVFRNVGTGDNATATAADLIKMNIQYRTNRKTQPW